MPCPRQYACEGFLLLNRCTSLSHPSSASVLQQVSRCPSPKPSSLMGERQVGPPRAPRASLLSDFTSNKSPTEEQAELSIAAPPPGELQAVSVCRTFRIRPLVQLLWTYPTVNSSPALCFLSSCPFLDAFGLSFCSYCEFQTRSVLI